MKKFINILLIVSFIAGLSSTFFLNSLHEIFGTIFIFSAIVHNVLNRNFYRVIFRNRFLNSLTITILILGSIMLLISGVMLWINFDSNTNWRSIHLISSMVIFVGITVHLSIHARRYIHGKIFYVTSILAFVLAVAGIFGLPYLDRWFHRVEVDKNQLVIGEKVNFSNKTAVIYFSRVGNTDFPANVDAVSGASVMADKMEIIGNAQMIAMMVNNAVDGDIFEIQTVEKYPADYYETTQAAGREFSGDIVPILKDIDTNFDEYSTIILIYPLWWGTLPKAVENFLTVHDFSNKTIIPIVTHGGSGVGESLDVIRKSLPNSNIKQPLDIYSSDISTSRNVISDFLKSVR